MAVSPDRPEELKRSVARLKLGYRLVSDSEARAALALGVAYRVSDALNLRLKGFGIDLEAASGNSHHVLPVPAVFIVDTHGRIQFQYANPDYKVRLHPEVLLAAARAGLGSG